MSSTDDVSGPAATPRPASGGSGCLLKLVLFVVIVIAGLVVGRLLGPGDAGDDEPTATIADGAVTDPTTGEDRTWRVDAEVDELDDTCVFFYEGDAPGAGACDDTPQAATIAGTTVVFGRVDDDVDEVTVDLSDGTTVDAATEVLDGFAGRFYAVEVPRSVEAAGLVTG